MVCVLLTYPRQSKHTYLPQLIHIRELADDFYEYDEENYCIKGRSTGKIYTLGDRVNIEVIKADLQKKQLDYRLVNN